MMVIDNKFNIGQKVYLVTDEEQVLRLITKIEILPNNLLSYEVSSGHTASNHYEFEIKIEKNFQIT